MMDEIDKKIISLLKDDARLSLTNIAGQVHRSRVAVANRIENLRASGEILKFQAVLKKRNFQAIFQITFNSEGRCDLFVAKLKKIHQISNAWSVAGSTDLLILVDFEKNEDIHELRNYIINQPEISTVITHSIIKTFS